MLSPAFPALGRDFSVQTGDLAWVFTLYLLVTVLSIAVASTMADRYGRRPVYLVCIALFAAGSIVAIVAPNYGIFLRRARCRRSVRAESSPWRPRRSATSFQRSGAVRRSASSRQRGGSAAVIGPSLGGLVTHFISWRWIFVANIPLAAIVFALAMRDLPVAVPAAQTPARRSSDLTLLCVGLARGDGRLDRDARLAVGIWRHRHTRSVRRLWEVGSDDPILPLGVLRTTQLVAKTYALEIVIGVLEGSLFFIPAVLVAAQGLSYVAAGFVAALGALMFVLVIPASGRALDRIGSRDVLLVGTMLHRDWAWRSSRWVSRRCRWRCLRSIVAGAGFGALLGAPTRYIVTNETPRSARATAVGLLSQA